MTTPRRRPLRWLVFRRLMPAAVAAGVTVWGGAAYVAHVDHIQRLEETLRQRLELRGAVTAERIRSVAESVQNAARNSITIGAMANDDVERIVQPYLNSIAFADAVADRVALLDYRSRIIVAAQRGGWSPPPDWRATFERVMDGGFESVLHGDRIIFAAPVVLGAYVEGALVADIALRSLFVDVDTDFNADVVSAELSAPVYTLRREGSRLRGAVTWPVADGAPIAVRFSKSLDGGGFWDNPVQATLLSVFAVLIGLAALAIVIAAALVAAPVRRLIEALDRNGLEIGAPSPDAPSEIWTLTTRFAAAAHDVEQALVRQRELTDQQRQFVSMVSHEFRTPLAIIDGAASALKRRRARMTPETVAEKLDVISSAVLRLLRLMESTLAAAKLDSAGFRIERTPVDLMTLIRRLAEERRSLSPDLTVEIDVDALPPRVAADEGLMISVIDNLLSNGVKYGGKPPRLWIRGAQVGHDAVFSVTDNGVGIPADQLARIGERFFRASTSAGVAGTGVGLNLVTTVLRQHGGALTVDSAVGEGSTFTVRLPVAAPADGYAEIATSQGLRNADLWRVIYTSRAAQGMDATAIDRICAVAAERNDAAGVTGALAYAEGRFAQVLEGPRGEVEALLASIRRDARHRDMTIVSAEAPAQRAYGDWRLSAMASREGMRPLEALQADLRFRVGG